MKDRRYVFLRELMTLADELIKADNFHAVLVVEEMILLYDRHIAELKCLSDNRIPHDIAKEFTDHRLRIVSELVGDDYKTGYREGITHYLESIKNP